MRERGAVLIGTEAKGLELTTTPAVSSAALSVTDREYLSEREAIVDEGLKAGIAAARALHEIHGYNGGILWRGEFGSFEAYCRARWDYGKSHSYRLVDCGGFVQDLESQSPIGDSDRWMPRCERTGGKDCETMCW